MLSLPSRILTQSMRRRGEQSAIVQFCVFYYAFSYYHNENKHERSTLLINYLNFFASANRRFDAPLREKFSYDFLFIPLNFKLLPKVGGISLFCVSADIIFSKDGTRDRGLLSESKASDQNACIGG
jgi:hypothetical protein